MRHVTSLEALELERPAQVSIGAFDGVHRGHQALVSAMVRAAREADHAAVVITFFPHPSVVLRGRRPSFYITTPEEKAELLGALGIDAVVTHPFNRDVANIPAADFVAQLVRHARMAQLWCGEDFALGRGREGNVDYLRAAGAQHGFGVRVAEPVVDGGEIISSTRIRQTLRDGAVEQAMRYLGRPFRLTGEVVAGAHRGRQLGIPTANLAIWEERAVPAVGVYACYATAADGRHEAVVNIGFRPTFEGDEARPVVEAHLLDYAGDLYGQPVALDFIVRLRPEQKFSGADALLAQIRADITRARDVLAAE